MKQAVAVKLEIVAHRRHFALIKVTLVTDEEHEKDEVVIQEIRSGDWMQEGDVTYIRGLHREASA